MPLQAERSGTFQDRLNGLEAVIAGASGKTGQAIAKKLLTTSGPRVKGLVRDPYAAVHTLRLCEPAWELQAPIE